MKINQISVVFFSATGRTRRAAEQVASALPLAADWLDITPHAADGLARSFGPDELVVWAAPVYGGRLALQAAQRFARLKGKQTPAVLLAVFGNRDYDDALLEMQDISQAAGFVPFACAAPVAEHSLMPGIAAGRPDEQDAQQLADFARGLWQTLQQAPAAADLRVPAVKGKRPYKDYPSIPFNPAASQTCVQCGVCARACPAGAIPLEHPNQTDKTRCISCMRCVSVCPQGARSVNKLLLAAAGKAFALKFGARKEPEFFIGR